MGKNSKEMGNNSEEMRINSEEMGENSEEMGEIAMKWGEFVKKRGKIVKYFLGKSEYLGEKAQKKKGRTGTTAVARGRRPQNGWKTPRIWKK